MRAALTTSFLLVSMLLLSGCGSSSQKAEADASQAQAAVAQRADFKKCCGDPIRFPISDECLRLAGNDGPRLRRQNDLTVAMWRACAMLPSSAETIRQEAIARGDAKTEVGQKLIGEMERTEQHSDSPCVAADLRDLDCVAGNAEACENARNSDPGCTAWLSDNDTQQRLHCLSRAVHDQSCLAKQPEGAAARYFSDAPREAEDCRRVESACLHTFDECSTAKDALEHFLKPPKPASR